MTDRKKEFIRELAEFLIFDVARRSIELEMGKPDARAWARLRNLTPLHGYPTLDEAEEILRKFLE